MLGKILVVNKRKNGVKAPVGYKVFDISGTSRNLGNPFTVEKYGGRDGCIAEFRKNWKSFVELEGVKEQLMVMVNEVIAGNDIALSCWCAPLNCHGNVIKELIEKKIEVMTEQLLDI